MNPPANPHAAAADAAMRKHNTEVSQAATPQRGEILLTWTRYAPRTVSDEEIAEWYAVAWQISEEALKR